MAAFQVWVTIQKKNWSLMKFETPQICHIFWKHSYTQFSFFITTTSTLISYSQILRQIWTWYFWRVIYQVLSDQPWKNSKMISVHLSDLTFSIPFQVYVPNSMECWNFFVKEKKSFIEIYYMVLKKKVSNFSFFLSSSWSFFIELLPNKENQQNLWF